MQNRKEDSMGFLKTIKNKVHDWWVSYDRKLWTARIFAYSILLLLVISVGVLLFIIFNLFHTDADSARYMLSALVQSQAAIVAIVITLTLIAVQLTASAYSPRVVDIFKKTPDMWILLGCYGASIFYGLIVLKLVEGAEGELVSQSVIWSLGWVSISFEFCVSLAYWLGAFTFVILVLYMWDIFNVLTPANIISILALDITKDKLKDAEEDPIQSIVDIINGAITKYDLETTRVGLDVITQQVIKLLDHDDEEKIAEWFCEHLNRISRLAISIDDVESTSRVITNLEIFTKSSVEKELENAPSEAISTLKKVGIIAAKKELENATFYATKSLERAGRAAMEKGLNDVAEIAVTSLKEVGVAAAEQELSLESGQAAKGLEAIGVAAAEKGLEHATGQVAYCLEAIGVAAAKQKLSFATGEAARCLQEVGKSAAKNKLKEDVRKQVAVSLVIVGIYSMEKELEPATRQVAKSLAELTILSEKVVKTIVPDFKPKFKKLYEQELEKLRAEE